MLILNKMDKTRNIYVLIVLAVSIVILFGVFFMVFQSGVLHNQSQQEGAAIERLRELNEDYQEKLDSNLIIIKRTEAALDSFMAADEERFIIELDRIDKSKRFVSRIPHMSNDSIKIVYANSWNYLLNEYRSGRLMPAE